MKIFFREFFLNIVLGYFSTILIALSLFVVIHFIIFSTNLTIVSTNLVCEQPLNNRCVTHYQAVTNDRSVIDFVPVRYEFSNDDLVIGSHLEKNSFSINYKVNGIAKDWQYWQGRIIRFLIGLTGLLVRHLLIKSGFTKGNFFKQLILQSRNKSYD